MEIFTMIDNNTRNCNLVKKKIDILFVVVGAVLAQVISDNFLNGTFIWSLIILIVFLLIMTPVKISIDSRIDRHYLNKDK